MYESTPRSHQDCKCQLQVKTQVAHTGVCTGVCTVSRATAKTGRGIWRDSHTGGDKSTCLGVGRSTPWIDSRVDSKIYKLKYVPSAATRLCNRLWNNYQGHSLVDCKIKPAGGQCSVHFPEPSRLWANFNTTS